MKIHITNQYGLFQDIENATIQKRIAGIGHQLGFYELGLYVYDVSTDTGSELSKRIDGIISSIENNDIAIVQLPTGNGSQYENMLIDKLVAYAHRKVILLWTDIDYYNSYRHDYYNRSFFEIKILDNSLIDDDIKSILQNVMSDAQLHFNIVVKGIDDTLDHILKYNSSVARFGDGEMDIISGQSIPYQKYNSKLAHELSTIISLQSNERFIVCLSDVFEHQERYNEYAIDFWKHHLSKYHDFYTRLCHSNWYGSTFISRPYIDLKDKSVSNHYFNKIKQLWDDRSILIVEGKNSRSGVGNDLFNNASSISRIICPPNNAYEKIDSIQSEILRYAEDKLILLMLGPTAKVLSKRLSDLGYHAIDLGHIDSEYEWFKLGATTKVKLKHKHTAEHNFDEDIEITENLEYNSQILATID